MRRNPSDEAVAIPNFTVMLRRSDNQMACTISYISGGLVETERWIGKLSVAQAVAKRTVAEGRANRVEIHDEAGDLLFQYPREVPAL